jgi:hypothetical protein
MPISVPGGANVAKISGLQTGAAELLALALAVAASALADALAMALTDALECGLDSSSRSRAAERSDLRRSHAELSKPHSNAPSSQGRMQEATPAFRRLDIFMRLRPPTPAAGGLDPVSLFCWLPEAGEAKIVRRSGAPNHGCR